jgi:hypothetical protein
MSVANETPIPRGIEVLMKKAAIDDEFRSLLMSDPLAAASEIGLELDRSERLVLTAATPDQLKAVIAKTHVPETHRRFFLGRAAAAMLAALAVVTVSSGCKGIRPDQLPEMKPDDVPEAHDEATPPHRPRRVEPSHGDRPPAT